MAEGRRDPLQKLLLSKAQVYIGQLKEKLYNLGHAEWELWQLTFDTLDSIRDPSDAAQILKEILDLVEEIYFRDEKVFVLSTALKYFVLKRAYLSPKELYFYSNFLLDLIYEDPLSLTSASALAKLLFVLESHGDVDLKDDVEGLVNSLMKEERVEGDWLAEFYSEYGSLVANSDVSLSEQYLQDALSAARELDESRRVEVFARIAIRYSYTVHSKDTKNTILSITDEIWDYFAKSSIDTIGRFLDLAVFLHKVDPATTEDYLSRIFVDITSVRGEPTKPILIQKYLAVLEFIGLDELKSKVLDYVANRLDLLDGESIYGPYVASLLVRFSDLSVGFKYELLRTILEDLDKNLFVYSHPTHLSIAELIFENILTFDVEFVIDKLNEIIDSRLGKLYFNETGVKNILRLLSALKPSSPRFVDRKARDIVRFTLNNNLAKKGLKLLPSELSDLSKSAYLSLLEYALDQYANSKGVNSLIDLSYVLAPLVKLDEARYLRILEEFERDYRRLEIRDRMKVARSMAENLANFSYEEAKYWYRKAIRECEIIMRKNKRTALKEIASIIKSIEEVLGDKTWSRQLRSYYLTLDIFIGTH